MKHSGQQISNIKKLTPGMPTLLRLNLAIEAVEVSENLASTYNVSQNPTEFMKIKSTHVDVANWGNLLFSFPYFTVCSVC